MVLILVEKILSLMLMAFMGMGIVRLGILKDSDSKVLSTLSLYLIMPCVLINAFQVDFTLDVRQGLMLSVAAAVLIHLGLVVLTVPMKKFLHLNPVEVVSVMYSNAGNLIIPLVTGLLGKEWVIYASGFLVVQMILLWSHGKGILCGEKGFDPKKLITNVNMIAIFIGILLFLTGIRLPRVITDTMDSMAVMVGPAAMLVTGMLIGGMDLKQVFIAKRLWFICALRLLAVPALVLLVMKLTGAASLAPDGDRILLITFLAVITPSASSISQMAQVYGQDAGEASAVNVLSTILCAVTMPAMILLYQAL